MDLFSEEYPQALKHISLIDFKEVGKATWRLGYYAHETFLKFKDKKEAFASFRVFVDAEVKRCHDTCEDIST